MKRALSLLLSLLVVTSALADAPAEDTAAKFKKALPLKIYDADAPAWRSTLEPDGKVSMQFSQGDFIKGWGEWKIDDDTLSVHRVHQQQKDPATGKPAKDKEHATDTEYKIEFKDNALLLDGNKADKEGVFNIPPR